MDTLEFINFSINPMKDKEPIILAKSCRCSVLGQQDRKDICHHKDMACHFFTNEWERCSELKDKDTLKKEIIAEFEESQLARYHPANKTAWDYTVQDFSTLLSSTIDQTWNSAIESKQVEHCAEPDCPECNMASYNAGILACEEELKNTPSRCVRCEKQGVNPFGECICSYEDKGYIKNSDALSALSTLKK